jgi:hypothetical protein
VDTDDASRPYDAEVEDLISVARRAWRNLHELLMAVNPGGDRWNSAWARQDTVVGYLVFRLQRLSPPPEWLDCHTALLQGLRSWRETIKPLSSAPDKIDNRMAAEAFALLPKAGAAIEQALRCTPDGRGLQTLELFVPPLSERFG